MAHAGRYPKQVFWSDEDEGYIAIAPDLPGCSAFGETEAQALAELDPAIDAWIEAAQKAGNPVPKASRPAEEEVYSGKFLLRVPKSLHADLARRSKREGVSLNQYVSTLLSWTIAARTFDAGFQITAPPQQIAKSQYLIVVDRLQWQHDVVHHSDFSHWHRAFAMAPTSLAASVAIMAPDR